jgi:hypothetical protein
MTLDATDRGKSRRVELEVGDEGVEVGRLHVDVDRAVEVGGDQAPAPVSTGNPA